jgi:DNA-binding transcriptional regulator YhcF (GntR family)
MRDKILRLHVRLARNENGESFPSNRAMAGMAGCSRSTVKRHQSGLVHAGTISRRAHYTASGLQIASRTKVLSVAAVHKWGKAVNNSVDKWRRWTRNRSRFEYEVSHPTSTTPEGLSVERDLTPRGRARPPKPPPKPRWEEPNRPASEPQAISEIINAMFRAPDGRVTWKPT